MANEYFTLPGGVLQQDTLARSAQVRSLFVSIEAAFDKLPDASAIVSGTVSLATDSGAANAYVLTLDPAPSAYTAGLTVDFAAQEVNTGASTVNLNGLGVKQIRDFAGNQLEPGMIPAGGFVTLRYDGTVFRLNSTVGVTVPADGSVTNAKMASAPGNTLKGRQSTDGTPQDLTATQARALLGLGTAALATAGAEAAHLPTNAIADGKYTAAAHAGAGGDAHPAATTSAAGFMTAADKSKLNGIPANAAANPATTDSRTDPSTTTVLQAKAMNDHRTSADHDSRYTAAAHAGSGGTAHAEATTSTAGFMSSSDKTKLNGIASGAQANPATTASRSDPSTTTVLQAKAMNDHRQSGDHDARYATAAHVGATGTAHGAVTTSVNGFMLATDKVKLNGIASGAQVNPATTAVRTSTSTSTVLQAKAMNDHRTSGDHDGRYARINTKTSATETTFDLGTSLSGIVENGQPTPALNSIQPVRLNTGFLFVNGSTGTLLAGSWKVCGLGTVQEFVGTNVQIQRVA